MTVDHQACSLLTKYDAVLLFRFAKGDMAYRRHEFKLLMRIVLIITLTSHQLLNVGAAASGLFPPLQHCTTIESCRLCTDSDKTSMDACTATGKIQTLSCPVLDEDQDETDQVQTIYISCKRTKNDDEFLLVRFQVLCLLFGTLACFSTKRQKSVSASLFDQRKMARSSEKLRRRTSELPNDIEMSEMTADQGELAALTEDDGLEVV